MLLNPLQLKLAAAGILVGIAAIAGVTIWALMERSGRLECKVDNIRLADQVDVLSMLLKDQTQSINNLGQATAKARSELRGMIAKIDEQHHKTRAEVASLEASLKAPTPKAADGRLLDCRDAIKAWREERRK